MQDILKTIQTYPSEFAAFIGFLAAIVSPLSQLLAAWIQAKGARVSGQSIEQMRHIEKLIANFAHSAIYFQDNDESRKQLTHCLINLRITLDPNDNDQKIVLSLLERSTEQILSHGRIHEGNQMVMEIGEKFRASRKRLGLI